VSAAGDETEAAAKPGTRILIGSGRVGQGSFGAA
jgi:hypothetical protein